MNAKRISFAEIGRLYLGRCGRFVWDEICGLGFDRLICFWRGDDPYHELWDGDEALRMALCQSERALLDPHNC